MFGIDDAIVASVGGAMVGGLLSNAGASSANSAATAMSREQMQWSSREAKTQRDWEAYQAELQREYGDQMSSTAYQRAMADMKKSGLNPILAYSQGGASTPSSGIPSSSLPHANLPQYKNTWEGAIPAVNTAISGLQTRSNVDLQGSQSALNLARIDHTKAQINLTKAQETLTIESVNLNKADQKVRAAEVALKGSQMRLAEANARFKEATIPAVEAVATVAKNVRDILMAIDDMLGMNKAGYKEAIQDAKTQIQGWVGTLNTNYKIGGERLLKDVEKSKSLKWAAKAWLRNLLRIGD